MRPTLAVLFLVNVLNFYDRQALGAVLEPLRREFQLSDRQLGAIPTAFIIVYALAGIPLARLADRWSRKRILAIGVSAWAALTALGGAATGYAMLFATRLGVGIGESVCAPAASSWIADIVPPQKRSGALAMFMMAVPAGVMLSFVASGPAAQAFGWRAALALAAAPALLLVPALLMLDEPPRARKSGDCRRPWSLLRIPALWWLAISGAIVNFILYSFSYFVSAFLTRFHGLSVAQAGVWSGIGSGVAGLLGGVAVVQFGGTPALRGGRGIAGSSGRVARDRTTAGERGGGSRTADARVWFVADVLRPGICRDSGRGPAGTARDGDGGVLPRHVSSRRRFWTAAGGSVERPLRARGGRG